MTRQQPSARHSVRPTDWPLWQMRPPGAPLGRQGNRLTTPLIWDTLVVGMWSEVKLETYLKGIRTSSLDIAPQTFLPSTTIRQSTIWSDLPLTCAKLIAVDRLGSGIRVNASFQQIPHIVGHFPYHCVIGNFRAIWIFLHSDRPIFIARQYTDARYWYSNSVRLSGCLSVRPSVRHVLVLDENGWT